jgi:hypothetical protein
MTEIEEGTDEYNNRINIIQISSVAVPEPERRSLN